MRILVLGGQGMLGHKVYQVLSEKFDTFVTFRDNDGPWRSFPMYKDKRVTFGGVDALHFDSIIRVFSQVKPDVVINCIGIIKQLESSNDAILSLEINSLFPHRLAALCRVSRTRLIQISTDCIFSGNKGNYSENDIPDAVDLYGRTKLLGEINNENCLTIRTSILGRDFLKKIGLLEWFLRNKGGKVKGFTKAIYSGFTTQALANILSEIIIDFPTLSGLYHVASQPISKFNLLTQIRDTAGLPIEIEPFSEYFCDRSLNAERFLAETNCKFPTWERMIVDLFADPTPYEHWS